MQLTQSDVEQLVGSASGVPRTDGDFDALVQNLASAGVDAVMIDAGQAVQLGEAGFDFDAGTYVMVNGTAVLRYHEVEGKVYGGWLTRPGLW